MKRTTHIPGVGRKTLWQKKWLRECLFSLPPGAIALLGIWRFSAQPDVDRHFWWASVFIAVWLALGLAMKIRIAALEDAKEEPDVMHEGVYAALGTLRASISHLCMERGFTGDIRATFHRVVPPLDEPEKIEQIIPYVGSQDDGMGRVFLISTGITGRAIRRQTPITMSSMARSDAEHRASLVEDWGYTEAQARALSPGRISAVALPVLDVTGRHVLGVIYLDSSERDIFEGPDIQQMLMITCDAVSDFVTQRY